MGKRSHLTSKLKNERRQKRKKADQRKKTEQNNHLLSVNPVKDKNFALHNQSSVYKFFKEEEHADALARGDVYLSTLENCRAYENSEQGDSEEAHETYFSGTLSGGGNDPEFVEQARRAGIGISKNANDIFLASCSNKKSIKDAYVLCASAEHAPENMNEAIGNKFCVEIKNPRVFFNAVSKKISSVSTIRKASMGKIIYADRSYTGLDQPPGPIGFVKPAFPYEKQKEFRFLWIMENMGEINPPLLQCPEISHLCKRIS
ncbi:hypothetical protein [Psychrobacter sp. AOP7-A1-24]|uniref:hypothetical protein n=1 Tax=Psychrobacter sp. AOP7-A1-24 TaxID=3457646 RepID=UPI00402B2D20